MAYPPTFEELYVVSDIHMGGSKSADGDFQIFNRGQRLANFITQIGKEQLDGDLALVLNGDIIDSLAERDISGYVAYTAKKADAMMEHLYSDASFAMVWKALASFVKISKRHLVLVIGNHDIELALPSVQASIANRLADADASARSRITFATQGAGFACQVGRARVFCTHGNEVDEWNVVDYNLLAQLANAINGGRDIDPTKWKPNAGSRLVVDVMNTAKASYPFVDLLKPEVAAIAGVLVALDIPAMRQFDFGAVVPIFREKRMGGQVVSNLLGEGEGGTVPPEVVAGAVAQQLLGANLRQAMQGGRSGPQVREDTLLLAASKAVSTGRNASEVMSIAGVPDTLGWWDVIKTKVGLMSPAEGLCYALRDWVADKSTYDVKTEDDTYTRMKDRVEGVDFLVTGHTHLARAISTPKKRFYYNTGTWIRLLRLTDEVLQEPETFEQWAWRPLTSGRMSDLDTAEIPGANGPQKLVFDRTNAVRIRRDGASVVGDLLRIEDAGPSTVTLGLEPGTTSFKVD